MKRSDDNSELPEKIRHAAAELRDRRPSADFDDRLRQALQAADREPSAPSRETGWGWGRVVTTVGLAAVGAVAAVAAFAGDRWVRGQPEEDVLERIEELEIAHDGDGHTWFPLTLETEHHDGADANLYVEAPREVRVKSVLKANADGEPACGPKHCVHRFESHPTYSDTDAHLEIGVSAPGDYRIFVEHSSPTQRVREVFLVAAR